MPSSAVSTKSSRPSLWQASAAQRRASPTERGLASRVSFPLLRGNACTLDCFEWCRTNLKPEKPLPTWMVSETTQFHASSRNETPWCEHCSGRRTRLGTSHQKGLRGDMASKDNGKDRKSTRLNSSH